MYVVDVLRDLDPVERVCTEDPLGYLARVFPKAQDAVEQLNIRVQLVPLIGGKGKFRSR